MCRIVPNICTIPFFLYCQLIFQPKKKKKKSLKSVERKFFEPNYLVIDKTIYMHF